MILTLGLLLLPKISPTCWRSWKEEARFRRRLMFGGVLVETLLSSLFAHIMMILQSSAVIDVFRGRDSGWKPQSRDDGSLPVHEIMEFHWVHMTLAPPSPRSHSIRLSFFFSGCFRLP